MIGRTTTAAMLILVLLLTLPLFAAAEEPSTLYVKKVENLPEGFIFGMDISSVLAEEASGVKYYDFDGNEADLFRVLADNGINYIRVRVWNNPYDDQGNGFGGGNRDLAAQPKAFAKSAAFCKSRSSSSSRGPRGQSIQP